MAVLFEGYFDESGDFEESPKIFCVAGYMIDSDKAKIMDEKWGEVLAEHKIPYFHMVDCAHGNGVFHEKTKAECIEIEKKLIALIKQYTEVGFAFLANADYFEQSEKHPDSYSACVSGCISALYSFLDIHRMKDDVAYFFETGHKNRGRAYHHVAEKLNSMSATLSFAEKQKVRLLQAADLLAWQCAKYAKDRSSDARPPRKDFLSLMEHRHSLAYMSIRNGQSALFLEEWPLSVRSPFSSNMEIDRDGPITLLMEEGDPRPIVMIKDPMGWRMGGGRSVYILVKDIGEKEFYLAFDDIRIRELISALIVAGTSVYPENPKMLAFLAKQASIEKFDEREAKLSVTLSSGHSLSFHLPTDAVSELQAQLDALAKN